MAVTTPTTMLEAVNQLLTAIGTTPVNTLEVPGLTDASIARDTIELTAREVQTRGWWFNTMRNFVFSPSGGAIIVPANITSVRPSLATPTQAGETRQFTMVSGKLFDLMTNSHTFTSQVRADVICLYDFEQLPESARWYITVRGARIFQTKVMGDDQLGVFTSVHEQEAFEAMERDHRNSAASSLYMDRISRRHAEARNGPLGHGPVRQQQQQGRQ
jgi:hypothetical protein